MKLLPLILFFFYIYLEVSLFVIVANHIGVFLALIALVATSILGVSLVKSQGIKNLAQIQQKTQLGENPTPEVVKSIALAIGGFLLLLPGFLTDIVGACLLLPAFQKLLIKRWLPRMSLKTKFTYQRSQTGTENKQVDDVIEGSYSKKDDEEITK